ncbi:MULTISPECIES: ImmA/IrrE family metallo-endopeptidase [unclassified Leucobacter]|uniref:ImmA/IrrE family metallo-endopeptidase n=1 Tax=unclassified Leucobacter TaxID=2621730 RepID=UPI00069B67F5|nr:ImmA/IrrE family metallo-endopeptidase [Leucobacter sp. Ag1]
MDLIFFDILDSLGVTVEYVNLEHLDRDGEYDHDLKLVRLQRDMAPRLHTFKLGHETCHALNGDVPSLFPHFDAKMERRADEWAATRLIAPERYREVEALRDGHVASMAHDLGVVSEAVEVYQQMLERIGDAVYLHPRMGVGQWSRKFADTRDALG